MRGPAWDMAQMETVAAVDRAAERFARAGARVAEVPPPPALGEHTGRVLGEIGLTPDEIAALR